MKQDIKKLQEFNSAVKADLEKYERQVHMMHEEIQGQADRNKQSVEELTLKVTPPSALSIVIHLSKYLFFWLDI